MFAIFETGAKQYKVSVGDTIYVEKLAGKAGDSVTFDKVLMCGDKIGMPYVTGSSITCQIVKQGKQPKITIIKHISQKHHTKKQGHRQPYTQLIVKEIK